MYIIFDEVPDGVIIKQREECFNAGANGEKLSQGITDARDMHRANVNALRTTISLFTNDEPKRRLHGKVSARLEQEQKWVKHFDACINEHKKGTTVAKLKAELETAKKTALKEKQAMREAHATAMDALRKEVRTQARKEFEDELKAKKKAKKAEKANKKPWYQWWLDLWGAKPKKVNPVNRAPSALMKEVREACKGKSAAEMRQMYLAKKAEQEAKK